MDASQSVALVIIVAVFLLRKQIKGFLRKPDDEEQTAERFEEDEAVWDVVRREKQLWKEEQLRGAQRPVEPTTATPPLEQD